MNQNALQKRQEMIQKRADAGFVSDKLPQIANMEINMVYYRRSIYSAEDKLLMLRTVKVTPESHAYFQMQCMTKECEGSFNLTRVIRKLVKDRKKRGTGNIVCKHRAEGLLPRHASVDYEIKIKFNRTKKK